MDDLREHRLHVDGRRRRRLLGCGPKCRHPDTGWPDGLRQRSVLQWHGAAHLRFRLEQFVARYHGARCTRCLRGRRGLRPDHHRRFRERRHHRHGGLPERGERESGDHRRLDLSGLDGDRHHRESSDERRRQRRAGLLLQCRNLRRRHLRRHGAGQHLSGGRPELRDDLHRERCGRRDRRGSGLGRRSRQHEPAIRNDRAHQRAGRRCAGGRRHSADRHLRDDRYRCRGPDHDQSQRRGDDRRLRRRDPADPVLLDLR